MDTTKQSPTVLSLCTGMRGLERGIERTGVTPRVLAYVEIEAFIIQNLVSQMEQGVLAPSPIWSNLKTLPLEPFRGKVDGIIGGYPCQPFSNAGRRGGVSDPRHLWPYIKEMVRELAPSFCFFENVAGHLTLGFDVVKRELEELHYKVEAGIFSAEEVGAPHRRERLFILAVRKLGNTEHNGLTTSSLSGGIGKDSDRSTERPEPSLESKRTSGREINGGLQRCETMDNASSLGPESLDSVQAGRNRPELASESLAYSEREGLERSEIESTRKKQSTLKRSGGADRWPSRPKQKQYEWEHPRTKSRLGFTVNGYNYREDLLRMAGNGVVEQTAELAWTTLWNKIKSKP